MKHLIAALLFLIFAAPASANSSPRVLVSVHPIALMAASLVPADQLTVLVPRGMTPHDFSLRPSDIDSIQTADIIIWAGVEAEPYLKGFVKRWPDKVWLDISQFKTEQDPNDPHWWLSPRIMTAAQQRLAAILKRDAGSFAGQLEATLAASKEQLAPVSSRGFYVFHRAYDHYVNYMQLNQLGAFTLSPEVKPGIRTLQNIRNQINQGDVACVFSEPEFPPTLVESVLKGTQVPRGELDPMATDIPLQADGYALFLQDLAQRLVRCLTPTE